MLTATPTVILFCKQAGNTEHTQNEEQTPKLYDYVEPLGLMELSGARVPRYLFGTEIGFWDT